MPITNTIAIAMTVIATQSSELKTNLTETSYESNKPGSFFYSLDDRRALPPQEKWLTTVVTKDDVLQFVWMGSTNLVRHTELVSSNTVHLRIKQEWEVVK